MQPLVSICLPVKNGLNNVNNQKITFKETLDNIIGQTYENIEIIISDNCSSDGTTEFIKSYEKINSRVKIFF